MNVLFVLAYLGCASAAHPQMCIICLPGKYQTRASNVPCQDCAFNTYSVSSGATACTSCEQNSFSSPGSSNCTCALNYARASNSSSCTFACDDGRVQVGYTCECPAGMNGTDRGVCALCPVHTYSSQVGSRVCTLCPVQMRSAAGSVSEGACMCSVGFVKQDSACIELLPVSVVTQVDIVLQQSSTVDLEEVRQAISTAVSVELRIPEVYIIVDVALLLVASFRRLMQTSFNTTTYSVTIRVLFAANASDAFVNETQSAVGIVDTLLLAGISTHTNGTKLTVLNSTVPMVRNVQGIFNPNSRELVSCTLVSWQDERGVAQACMRTCGANEDLVAVAYVQGLYVLDCQRKTSTLTPAPPGQPPPPPGEPSSSTSAIVGGVVGAVAFLLVLGSFFACRICRVKPPVV